MTLINNADNFIIFNQYIKSISKVQVSGGRIAPSKYIILNGGVINDGNIGDINNTDNQNEFIDNFWDTLGNIITTNSWYADEISIQSYDEKGNYVLNEIFIHIPGGLEAYNYGITKGNIPTGLVKTIRSNFNPSIKHILVFYNEYDANNNILVEDIPMGIYISRDNISYNKNPLAFRLYNTLSNGSNLLTISVNSEVNESIINVLQSLGDSATKMVEISREIADKIEMNRDIYHMIKNQRNNVPYIKQVGGEWYWFVNGKQMVTTAGISSITNDEINNMW